MGAGDTVRIQDPDYPDGILINAADFDPARHTRFAGVDEEGGENSEGRDTRAKALTKLPAAEVQVLAEAIGVEYTNKGAAIEAILEAEFPAD